MRKRLIALVGALTLFAALFVPNLAPASAAGGNGAPKHLSISQQAAPRLAVISEYNKGKTCTDGVYRIQTTTRWWTNGTYYAPVSAVMTQQRMIGNPAVWQNNDWANSAHIYAWANGSQWGADWGPANPGTSVSFTFTGQGFTDKANQYVQYNISGTGAGTPNIQCRVTP